VTGPHESLTRRRALASFGVLAGLTGMGCASSNAATAGVARPRPGALLWRSQPLVDGEYVLGLVPAGGVICVGDGFGNIYGLNAASGGTLWRRTFRDNSAGYLPLAAAGGRVFAVGSGRVAALSAATGRQLWSVPASGVEPGFPPQLPTYFVVYTNGVVCVLDAHGNVAGLDPRTGRAMWRRPPASAGFAAGATADNGVLYVAETAGKGGVTALDVRTGRPRWSAPTPSVASTLLALDSVIAGTPTASPSYDAGQLTFALDKATGRPLWRANFDTQTYSSIAGEGDRVYVHVDLLAGAVTEGTAISALAARSGRKLWQDTFPSQSIGGTIAAAGGRLYAGFQEGILRALSPATGAVLWRRTTLGEVTSITSGPRAIYASASGPRGGTIYAIWQ
jgi:outer membrane protein assembly factor BamB